MTTAHPIKTVRLILRPFEHGDIDALFEYHSRADVTRFLHWDTRTRSETETALEKRLCATALSQEGDTLILAAALAKSSQIVGEVCMMWRSEKHRQCEIGFIFNPCFQGQGYATEAATAMLSLGFEKFGFHRIFGRCDVRNTASFKLMERLGMRCEAHFIQNEKIKGQWSDELVYAILKKEWPTDPPNY